jgi:NitT/TauT family transport system substrate-binding protein
VIAEVEPFIEPLLRDGKVELLSRHYQAVAPNTLVATYATTSEWLRLNVDAAKRFRAAFELADRYMKDNPSELRTILSSYTRLREGDLAVIGLPAFDLDVSANELGRISAEMIRFGFVESAPAASQVVTTWESPDGD